MISERISDNIPPKWKKMSMVIPIQMHCCSLDSNWDVASSIKSHKSAGRPKKGDVINDVQLFPTVHRKV